MIYAEEEGKEPEIVDDFTATASSRPHRADTHMNLAVTTHIKPAQQVQARQNPSM